MLSLLLITVLAVVAVVVDTGFVDVVILLLGITVVLLFLVFGVAAAILGVAVVLLFLVLPLLLCYCYAVVTPSSLLL